MQCGLQRIAVQHLYDAAIILTLEDGAFDRLLRRIRDDVDPRFLAVTGGQRAEVDLRQLLERLDLKVAHKGKDEIAGIAVAILIDLQRQRSVQRPDL